MNLRRKIYEVFTNESVFIKYFLFIFIFTFSLQKLIFLPLFNYKIQISEIVFVFGFVKLIINKSFLNWLVYHKLNLIDKAVIAWIFISLINLIINWNLATKLEFIGQIYMVLIYSVVKYYLLKSNKNLTFYKSVELSLMLFYGICVSLIFFSILHYIGLFNKSPFLYCADYPYFGAVYRLRAFTNEPVMLVSYLSLPFIIIAGQTMSIKSKKWIFHFIIASLLLILTLGKSLPIILAVVLVFIVLHFYKTGFNKVSFRIIALIFVIFSFFFSNFHILNKKLVSNKYLEETQYIDPDKVFSYTNYDVYGNWYWRQKINGVKIFKLAPFFGVGGGNLINIIKEERNYLNFTDKFSASDPICTYTGVLSEFGLLGFFGLLFLFGSIYFCYYGNEIESFELKIFIGAFTYLLLEGLCTDIMNFKHLWVIMAIISTIISNNFINANINRLDIAESKQSNKP